MENLKQRNVNIDIIKGISIILMVYAHSSAPFVNFIYLFHMAVFFMASGYCWNQKHADSRKSLILYIWKKIKGLYIPFVLINIFFILVNNIFIDLHIYTDNLNVLKFGMYSQNVSIHYHSSIIEMIYSIISVLFFGGSGELGSSTWFIRTLFFVTIFHAIFCFVFRNCNQKVKTIFQILVYGIFLICAYVISYYEIDVPIVSQFFAAYLLYYLGIIIKEMSMPNLSACKGLSIAIVSFSLLVVINFFESVSLSTGEIGNILLFILSSILGWTMLWYLADIIPNLIGKLIQYIGQHTLCIVLWHNLCFRLVSYIIVQINNFPIELVASFPTISNIGSVWWVAYCIAGVGISLFFGYCYSVFKRLLIQYKSKI